MKVNTWQALTFVFLVLHIQDANCVLHMVPVGLTGAGLAGIYAGYSFVKCKFTECCNHEYRPTDVRYLDGLFQRELFGQKIAHQTILPAIRGHLSNLDPIKPLVMSFHGVAGSGKNFAAETIAKALFEKGKDSQFVHVFNGYYYEDHTIQDHKKEIQNTVIDIIKKCERSIFIFDEVQEMPEGMLNILVPILEYTSLFKVGGINKNKSIFIFLSNIGQEQILKRMLELWESGKRREEMTLQDFENLITIGAFNEKGGFNRSDVIVKNLIDHYIPFLPLEESHVRSCIERSFRKRSIEPTKEMIKEVLNQSTNFGPPPHNLYSNNGCKRVEVKVALCSNSIPKDL